MGFTANKRTKISCFGAKSAVGGLFVCFEKPCFSCFVLVFGACGLAFQAVLRLLVRR
jgi:hypothetical protein